MGEDVRLAIQALLQTSCSNEADPTQAASAKPKSAVGEEKATSCYPSSTVEKIRESSKKERSKGRGRGRGHEQEEPIRASKTSAKKGGKGPLGKTLRDDEASATSGKGRGKGKKMQDDETPATSAKGRRKNPE